MSKLIAIKNLPDLVELRELYRKEQSYPRHGFYTLDNYVKWLEKKPQLKFVSALSLNGNWRESGLFLIVDRYQVMLNSLKPQDADVGSAMKLLDWSRGYKITSIPINQYEVVIKTLEELQIVWTQAQLYIFHLPNDKARKWPEPSCPQGYELRPLTCADADIVNELWPPRQTGSVFFVRRLIAYNISVGVYRQDTNELVAWCTRCQCGFLGMLFVKEAFRRCGLAKLVIQAFVQQVAPTGNDLTAMVHMHNHTSAALFRSIGFEHTENTYHIRAFAPGHPNEIIWPEAGH